MPLKHHLLLLRAAESTAPSPAQQGLGAAGLGAPTSCLQHSLCPALPPKHWELQPNCLQLEKK